MRMAKGMFAVLAMVLAAAACVSVQEVPMSTASASLRRVMTCAS